MASSSAATPDTLITLKVNFDGATRRFKLPLRELTVASLEDKLRAFLQISVGTAATIERYSDSAASFVVLHPTNIPAYKQLYRAAKAKQKLKLRVTTKTKTETKTEAEPEQVKLPKPVTVEDEVEAESKEVSEPAPRIPSPAPVSTEASTAILDTVAVSDIHSNLPNFVRLWRSHGMPRIHLRRDENNKEVVDLLSSTSMSTAEPLVSLETSEGNIPDIANRCPFSNAGSGMFQVADLVQGVTTDMASEPNAETQEAPEPQQTEETLVASKVEKEGSKKTEILASSGFQAFPKRPFTVCCNSCDRPVPDSHFHCSTCDGGDFDLCQDCVNQGITCYGEGHWLIKRTIKDGQVNYSTTHVAPKSLRPQTKKDTSSSPSLSLPIRPAGNVINWTQRAPGSETTYNDRTCNCCVRDLPGEDFLHCTKCADYDLCKKCFVGDKHGHHPGHEFEPAVKGTVFDHAVSSRLSAGRGSVHNAICDGCDKYVRGIRHKCLDCPDWDYCSECVQNANFIHPGHRFVAIYEPLPHIQHPVRPVYSRATHFGICCDGPLCSASRGDPKYIVGVRYKCAVCHDTDFCANCEASPSNTHNKTHPLIKFKTPVRHVSVTTTGEHEDGHRLPTMGDRVGQPTSTRTTGTTASAHESITATPVQTVVDVQPTEQQSPEAKDSEEEEVVESKDEVADPEVATLVEKQSNPADLVAVFQRDTVADGTILPPNHTFEQVWVLRNEGTVAWPAGCSVKFVGGDYMGAVDPTHPAGIHELVSASESTICYNTLNPGQEFPFTVLMRTPDREGKVISYWRLTTPDGVKFGHKLWCDVTVQAPARTPQLEREEVSVPEIAESQMIIPKLEHESPSASMHVPAQSEGEAETETDTLVQSAQEEQEEEEEDFEDCGEDDSWADSDEGFMTDEEYDILDASDEEYLSDQHKPASKK
ncbi:hypothetical protein GGS26DRAFT_369387 [Hypomontagnella submonticulosa]|nr:hypothetical protein GGS26DRAFT_369387 [Hypomontagnella submonticulosa]